MSHGTSIMFPFEKVTITLLEVSSLPPKKHEKIYQHCPPAQKWPGMALHIRPENRSLDWIPHPKGDYAARFSNNILLQFYQSYYDICSHEDQFRREYAKERKRQWNIKKSMKKLNDKTIFLLHLHQRVDEHAGKTAIGDHMRTHGSRQ